MPGRRPVASEAAPCRPSSRSGAPAVSVVVVGLDQRQAPLELLERVTIGDDALDKALCNLRDRSNLSEVAVLSTCQRTEIYAVVERFHDGVAELAGVSGHDGGRPARHLPGAPDGQVRRRRGRPPVRGGRRSRVGGGGGVEVLGQVRRAWERARPSGRRARCWPPCSAMRSRPASGSGRRPPSPAASTSLSHGAVALAAEQARPAGVVGGLAGSRVLVIGAGEMGEGVLAALAARPPGERPAAVTVANRTPSRARDAARRPGRRRFRVHLRAGRLRPSGRPGGLAPRHLLLGGDDAGGARRPPGDRGPPGGGLGRPAARRRPGRAPQRRPRGRGAGRRHPARHGRADGRGGRGPSRAARPRCRDAGDIVAAEDSTATRSPPGPAARPPWCRPCGPGPRRPARRRSSAAGRAGAT